MHYYQHHIGDFRSGTFNMTKLERWIYRDMLEVYYDREEPFPDNFAKIFDMIGARRDDERETVAALLLCKFELTERGYVHERCEAEIVAYHAKAHTARSNGKTGGRPRKNNPEKPSGLPVGSEEKQIGSENNPIATGLKANHKPLTNNHKPVTSKDKGAPPPGDAVLFPDVDLQVVADFKALRNKHKAPITATAMQEMAKQAALAGMSMEAAMRVCCSQGWRGFKAEWVAPKSVRKEYQTPNEKARSFADRLTGKDRRSDESHRIIDITPADLLG